MTSEKANDIFDVGFSWRKMLQARPVRNAAGQIKRDNEHLKITIRKQKPRYLVPPLSWIVKPRMTSSMSLDRLGLEIWDLCDGRQTVESIVEKFAKLYDLSFHEARASVTGYIKILVRRGALVIVTD